MMKRTLCRLANVSGGQRGGHRRNALAHEGMSDITLLRKVVSNKLYHKKGQRIQAMRGERQHVVVEAEDNWPIHNKGVAYCPEWGEADKIIGGVVFDRDEMPEYVGFKIERRLSEYSPRKKGGKKADKTIAEGLSGKEGGMTKSTRADYLPNPIAVITISTEKHVIVLHVLQWGECLNWANEDEMPNFVRLLASNRVAKVCVGGRAAAVALKKEFNLGTSNFVDVSHKAKEVLDTAGVNGIYFQPHGFTFKLLTQHFWRHDGFPKPLRVTMSNWNILPLTSDQLVYTANHAYALVHMYTALQSIEARAKVSPVGPFYPAYVCFQTSVLRFPNPSKDGIDARQAFERNSDFHRGVESVLNKAFRGLGGVKHFWFPCEEGNGQTVAAGFSSQEFADKAVEAFVGHKSLLVTSRPVPWADAKEEFRLRMGGQKHLAFDHTPEETDKWAP